MFSLKMDIPCEMQTKSKQYYALQSKHKLPITRQISVMTSETGPEGIWISNAGVRGACMLGSVGSGGGWIEGNPREDRTREARIDGSSVWPSGIRRDSSTLR